MATTGLELIQAGRWLNVLLFGLTIALAGSFFIWKWKSPLAGCLIAIMIAFSPSMIAAHAWLLSEPLYYFFGTISLLALVVFLSGKRWIWLVLSASAAALAALDRYAGLALAFCGLAVLLFQPSTGIVTRIKRIAVYGLISLAPTGIWLWVVRMNSASIAGREFRAFDGLISRLIKLIGPIKETLISWVPFSDLLPFISDPHQYKPFWIFTILVLIALAALLVMGFYRQKDRLQSITEPRNMLVVFTVFMECHLLVFIGATLFLTASPSTGDRNFAPLLFSVYFLLSALLIIIFRIYQGKNRVSALLMLIIFIIIGISLAQGIKAVAAYPAEGLGYNTRSARQSPIYAAIRSLPEDLLLVCNNPNVILFHTNRGTYPLVEMYTVNPDWDFPVYGQGKNKTDPGQLAFEDGLAALILLPDAFWEFELVYGDRTDERMAGLIEGLFEYYGDYDGAIYLKDESVLNK